MAYGTARLEHVRSEGPGHPPSFSRWVAVVMRRKDCECQLFAYSYVGAIDGLYSCLSAVHLQIGRLVSAPHRRTPSVVIWSKMPPPVGGVSRSAALLDEALRLNGVSTVVVDLGRFGRAAVAGAGAIARRDCWNLFNVSTLSAVRRAALIGRTARGPSCVYLHGGGFLEEWPSLTSRDRRSYEEALRQFDFIWCTNSQIAGLASTVAPHSEVRIVSPYPLRGKTSARSSPGGRASVLVSSYGGRALYGVDIAVDAVRRYRQRGVPLDLDIVTYGPTTSVRLELEARDIGNRLGDAVARPVCGLPRGTRPRAHKRFSGRRVETATPC